MENESTWKRLYERRILFTVSGSPSVLFGQQAGTASEEILASRGIPLAEAEELARRVEPEWFPYGTVIDIQFLRKLVAERVAALGPGAGLGRPAPGREDEAFRDLAELSRVRLQGTDGLRGKARDLEVDRLEALGLFLREGVVTPAFLALSAEALGTECLENALVGPQEGVVVGADGRDPSGRFALAVCGAFAELGFDVLDAGVIATPGVPLYARYAKCKLGAIVTASHNPSNQNGIKFVYGGFKLENDGPAGEYGLTAYMYRLADRGAAGEDDRTTVPPRPIEDARERAADLLYRVDMENAGLEKRSFDGLRIVYDGANGAYSQVAKRVLAELGADFTAVNVDPRGYNINQGGGVGELEGHAFFEDSYAPDAWPGSLSTVRAMFEEGRAAGDAKRVFGIVNDGDGDRGYLLVYSPHEDRVYVVPGDEIAFWLARGRRDSGDLGDDPVCVNSVESDVLAGYYMRRLLGLESETACVGDKNLLKPAREGRNHIVGCEESGHVTFGVRITDKDGASGMVYTGNGLLSVLRAVAVIQGSGAALEEIVHPFPPGAKDCRYVYFVDKSRFYRGSPAWRKDEALATELMQRLEPEGYSVRRIDFPDDPQMLYLACLDPEGLRKAALFVRNSGTETKNSVTIRCAPELYPMMRKAMLAVHARNRGLLKDGDNRDAIIEARILEALGRRSLSRADLKTRTESSFGAAVDEIDFAAILFAMRKEGLLAESGESIRRVEE